MKEIFDLSFSPANIFPTVLLLIVTLYWLVFLVGLLDLQFLDFDAGAEGDFDVSMDKDISIGKDIDVDVDVDADVDVGMDKDVDVDADADVDKDVGAGKGSGVGIQILKFLNLGDVPFMIFFSFFALLFWAFSVLGNHYWAGENTGLIVGVLASSFIVAALFTKVITQPFRGMFRKLNADDAPIDFRGKLCVLEVGVEGKRMGQADIVVRDKHLLINVVSESGEPISRGTKCLIVDIGPNKDYYTITPFDIDN